jgi:short-subunit dehydrogenase
MAKPLDQQVVVITGASSGIGRATALRLARKGAKVVVSARRDEALDDLVEEIKLNGGEATSIPADVSIFSEVEALAQGALATYGRIDTWVNNAGVLLVGEFQKTDLEEARRLFDVNFWGELHGCKVVLPILKAQGSGTIVNVTSMTARRPLPLMSVYSASKAALNGLTDAICTEIKGTGINLSVVMPASIDTPLYQHARTKEGVTPRPAPPIYPPSEVARAIEMCATSKKRDVIAGPAGIAFHVGNFFIPSVLDKALAAVGRKVELTDEPEPSRGQDNFDGPMHEVPATSSGGWRGKRYKTIELGSRIALGATALLVARKLAGK